jgi:hypothetical protein
MADPLLASLKEASEGLLYPSESDAPFEPFRWPGGSKRLTPARAATLAGKRRAQVEEVPVEDFFSELTDSDDGPRFRKLEESLRSSLSDLRVFRIGKVKVVVYLVGRAPDGSWVGLQAESVET